MDRLITIGSHRIPIKIKDFISIMTKALQNAMNDDTGNHLILI